MPHRHRRSGRAPHWWPDGRAPDTPRSAASAAPRCTLSAAHRRAARRAERPPTPLLLLLRELEPRQPARAAAWAKRRRQTTGSCAQHDQPRPLALQRGGRGVAKALGRGGQKGVGAGGGRGLTGGSAPRVAPSGTGPRAPARAERSSRAGTPARRSAPTKNHSRGGAAMHTPAVSACAKCASQPASQGECLASPPPRSSCARQIYAPPRGVSECPGPHKPCVCASTRARCPIIICVIIDSLTTRRARR
jgi:hypothetical protein